jgi:hypothetical protein
MVAHDPPTGSNGFEGSIGAETIDIALEASSNGGL